MLAEYSTLQWPMTISAICTKERGPFIRLMRIETTIAPFLLAGLVFFG